MKNKSKDKINIYQNKPINKNPNKSKNMTYNKPLFINIKNENSINNNTFNFITKNSSCSTKICSTSYESPLYDNNGNNNSTNRVYSVKDFDTENNYSKTSLNFFSKYINTSISSNEDYNYETFTPSRQKVSPFNEDEKEQQFTPYLGQKASEEKNNIDNMKESSNNDNNLNNHEKNKYSNIFNNSKNIIESASLNLNSHFDEQLSNNYKIINKYQKLSFYQKKNDLINNNKSRNKNNPAKKANTNYSTFIKFNNNSKVINKLSLYKKKSDLSFRRENERKKLEWFYIHNIDISQKELYENNATLIQSIYRGYILRIKLYNKLKLYTCITVFIQILNNVYMGYNKYLLDYTFKKILLFIRNNKRFNIYKTSFVIEGNENKNKILCNEIKELIEQNTKLQLKLNDFLINNNILKDDLSHYKEFELKYNKLLVQLEKLQNFNNNIIRDNTRLNKELNVMKNSKIIKNDLIQPHKVYTMKINKTSTNKKLEICKDINNILIQRTNNIKNNFKNDICSKVNNLTIINNNNKSFNKFKNIDICKNINQIEIKNIILNQKFKKLSIENNLNNITLIPNININKNNNFKTYEIEKQNNIYITQISKNTNINDPELNNETKDELLSNKNQNNNLQIENLINLSFNNINTTNIDNNELKKEEKEVKNVNEMNQIPVDIVKDNKLDKDMPMEVPKADGDNKDNLEKNQNVEKLINMRSSLRISFRNEKIESQEVNLELEESNLSKEEILKRKRLRNLFKNKLFLLRDITRKYFLRFYYNGIYIKMVGKKPISLDTASIMNSDLKNRKRRNTSSAAEKGRYLRKIMDQKKKEKKDILKNNFNILMQNIFIPIIRKKLINYGKEIKNQRNMKINNILISLINKKDNGSFRLSNIKRCVIIWRNKIKIMKKNDRNILIEENLEKDDDEEEENEEVDDDNYLDNYIINNLYRNSNYDKDEIK